MGIVVGTNYGTSLTQKIYFMTAKYRTWVEINKEAIAKNYATFRGYINKHVKLMSVVKSNAYGHDIIQFAQEITKLGVDWLGVDSAVEALVLRNKGLQTPILVLGYTLPYKYQEIVQQKIHITISSFSALDSIKEEHFSGNLSGKILAHIKVDTGMGRQGFLFADREKLFHYLEELKDVISVEGLYTHFAAAKNPDGPDETYGQIQEFKKWIELFHSKGYKPLVHASATSGALLFPEARFDMIRVGIGMYGLWPSPEVKVFAEKNNITLYPALSWKTIISEIKYLPQGSRVGYDFTEELKRDSVVAICPIGYWHGYMRSLSSKGFVLVRGTRAKVLGRVSMGMIVIDITDIPKVTTGDEVILIGGTEKNKVSADFVADLAGTINYEIVTCINPRICRIYYPE